MGLRFANIHRMGILAFCVLFIGISPSLADAEKQKRLISLSGTGEISASPDIAHVTSGVVTQAKTAAQALQANSAAMTRIIDGLKASNIAAKDIQTSGFSVNPSLFYDQNNRRNPPKIIGYMVRNQVKITVHKRDTLGHILDKMISLGANQINGISFAIDKPQALQDEARKLAVKDALRKANIYAAATGSKLGRIVSLNEGQVHRPVQQFALRSAAVAEQASVPIEAGQHTVRIQVNITWELE